MPNAPQRQPQALQWDDEPPPATPEDEAELRELRREFWSKMAPPIYGTRVVDWTNPDKLSWD